MGLVRYILHKDGSRDGIRNLRNTVLTWNVWVDRLSLLVESCRGGTGLTSCIEILLPSELFTRELARRYTSSC